MSQLHAEVSVAQLSKVGEELCGDKIVVNHTPKGTIIVLSDGLGSGVKANILATLTTKIASSMLTRGIPLDDVVSTIADTLPVCRQRNIAYSTLHILKIAPSGLATIVEFDCPQSFLIRDGKVMPFPSTVEVISGKSIKEGKLLLVENDIIVAVSDGIIHAGIGGLLKLGWGWKGIADHLQSIVRPDSSAHFISDSIIRCSEGYYLGQPGDDSSIVTVKIRKARQLTILTGPPVDHSFDEKVVKRFMNQPGKKIVAGGTTAHIVSNVCDKPLIMDLSSYNEHIPPMGFIEGIDLVTEGILTLNAVLERIGQGRTLTGGFSDGDAADRLIEMLLDADKINIFAGKSINPAHQNPTFPFKINIKSQVLTKLQAALEAKGKEVIIEWF
ncbi:hypothetical protein SDC9_30248 [bioreactor metagenome]|uniref:PPM-type phosphatase domain-containing protein n=1 Tax=bioreactor metagenome TaxID=1076179 RepID=A0A644V052_9ZZZZ